MGILIEIHVRGGIRGIQTPREQVREFVKLPKFPFSERSISSGRYGRRILLSFLMEDVSVRTISLGNSSTHFKVSKE
jgi:hypothetical protein